MVDPTRVIPIVRQAESSSAVILARIEEREKAAVQFTQEHILAQGEDLAKLKECQGHGNWTRWAAKNLTTFGLRQAQNYLRIWERAKNEVPFVFESLEHALRLLLEDEEDDDEPAAAPGPAPEPSLPAVVYEPDDDEPEAQPESEAEAKPTPVPLDSLGIRIPEALSAVFDPSHEQKRQECLALLRQLASAVDELAGCPVGPYLAAELRRKGRDEGHIHYEHEGLVQLRHQLQQLPIASCCVCPYCLVEKNPQKKGRHCACCHGHGWVPPAVFQKSQGLPESCRAALEALKEGTS